MSNNLIPLSELINFEELPSQEGNLKEGISSIFSKLFVSNLRIDKEFFNEKATYNFDLVTITPIEFKLFGSDLKIIFNPSNSIITRTEIPITFYSSWALRKYINVFKLSSFDFSTRAFYNLLLDITGNEGDALLFQVLEDYYPWTDDVHSDDEEEIDIPEDTEIISPIEKFLLDFNSQINDTGIPIVSPNSDTDELIVKNIASQIEELGLNLADAIFFQFILSSSSDETIKSITSFFKAFLNEISAQKILELLLPSYTVSINSIRIALEFPRTVLKPIYTGNSDFLGDTTGFKVGEVITDENIKSRLTFDVGSLNFSTQSGFEFNNTSEFSFNKSQIGDTGFTLEFDGAKIDLSRTRNIAEATADGRPDDFVGVFVEEAVIGFPAFWEKKPDDGSKKSTAEIFGENLLIGTGGISGRLGLRKLQTAEPGTESLIRTQFGKDDGFEIALDQFDLVFQQNSITESNICGTLVFPKNSFCKKDQAPDQPAEIDVNINLVNNEFTVTAAAVPPDLVPPVPIPPATEVTPEQTAAYQEALSRGKGITVCIPNLLDFRIDKVVVGKREDRFFLTTSGEFKFLVLPGILPEKLAIENLTIWSDGEIELPSGGFLELREPIGIEFGPAKLTITGIHIGSEERLFQGQLVKYKYFGFDGGISVDPGGVDARGSGLKFYYYRDETGEVRDFFIRLESLAIDIIIPGKATPETASAIINGFLSIKNEEGGQEYQGGVSLSLPKLEIAGSAAMRYKPSVPSFAVDVALDFSTPIVLGPTGTGIYGLRGLVGSNFIVDKNDPKFGLGPNAKWYDFYKKKVVPENREGISVGKLTSKNGFTVGAGVGLASAFDSGKVLSTKLMVIISPQLFYLEGQLALLKERVKLTDTRDLPFFAIIAISKESVYAGFGVNYKLPEDTGDVLTIQGKAELEFFFKNSSAWYVNIGTEEAPITAKALSLFNASAYLGLSVQGIAFGATASFGIDVGSNCFGLRGEAAVSLGGKVSFSPLLIGGYVSIVGSVDAKLFCVGIGTEVDIRLAVSGPRPLILCGRIKASLCVKLLIKKKCATLDFAFRVQVGRDAQQPPIKFLTPQSAQAKNMMTGEVFPVLGADGNKNFLPGLANTDNFTIPLDSFVEFEFQKGVRSGTDPSMNKIAWEIGTAGSTEYIPPQKDKNGNTRHTFSVEQVKIYAHKNNVAGSNEWEEYPVYDALVPVEADDLINPALAQDLKYASWQVENSDAQNKLVLLSTNPFNYLQQGTTTPIVEYLGLTIDRIICGGTRVDNYCYRPEELATDALEGVTRFSDSGATLELTSSLPILDVNAPFPDITKGLSLEEEVLITFPVPAGSFSTKLITTEQVKVSYFGDVPVGFDTNERPIYEKQLLKEDVLVPSDLGVDVVYESTTRPLKEVRIVSVEALAQDLVCDTADTTVLTQLKDFVNQNVQNGTFSANDFTFSGNLTEGLPADLATCNLELSINLNENRTYELEVTGVAGRGLRTKILVFEVDGETKTFTNDERDFSKLTPALTEFLNTNFAGRIQATYLDVRNVRIQTLNGASFSKVSEESVFVDLNDVTADRVRLSNVSQVVSVAPANTSVEGGNYTFLANVELTDGSSAVVEGRTDCFLLNCCLGNAANYYTAVCTSVESQIATLETRVVELNKLISNAALICRKLENADDACGGVGQQFCELETQYTTERSEIESQIEYLTSWIETNCSDLKTSICSGDLPVFSGSYLLEFCWLKELDYIQNENLPTRIEAIEEADQFVQTVRSSIQPIWRADTNYLVKILIKDAQSSGRNDEFCLNYQFKTLGPIGHFHQKINVSEEGVYSEPTYRSDFAELLAEGKADEYKLSTLREYIDYGKSFPNADGSIVNAKPLYYYDPKLYLFFKKNYVKNMFNGFRGIGSLEELSPEENTFYAVIADPSSSEVIRLDDDKQGFKPNTRPVLTREGRLMSELLEKNACYDTKVDDPKSVHFEVDLVNVLEPSRLYTAVYRTSYKSELAQAVVHQYNFQSSRYASFEEHVKSYQIFSDEFKPELDPAERFVNAFYDIKLTNEFEPGVLKPEAERFDIAQVIRILDDSLLEGEQELINQFMDPYDRLMNGGLKIKSLEQPETTEVNFVRDYNPGSDDRLLGVLVRSPEAFNDPKIPLEDLISSVRVLDKNGEVLTNYDSILISKDRAKIFITNTTKSIEDRYLEIELDYLIYDPDEGFIKAENGTSSIVIENVPVYKTKLVDNDCGRQEVELNDTISAFEVEDLQLGTAGQYFFNVKNSETDLTIESSLNQLLLAPLNLLYNRSYEVQVRAVLPDREVAFGETCIINTRALSFVIDEIENPIIYANTPVEIRASLQFSNGVIWNQFNETLELQDTNGLIASQSLQFVNGRATLTLAPSTVGTSELVVNDLLNTGYSISDSVTLEVTEQAVSLEVVPFNTTLVSNGVSNIVSIEARSANGVVDKLYNSTLRFDVTGDDARTISFVNGVAVANVQSVIARQSLLRFTNNDLPLSPSTFDVLFLPPNVTGLQYKYVPDPPATATVNTNIEVNVFASDGDEFFDTNYEVGFNLRIAKLNQPDELLPLVFDAGRVVVSFTSSVADTYTISIEETVTTGMGIPAPVQIVFNT